MLNKVGRSVKKTGAKKAKAVVSNAKKSSKKLATNTKAKGKVTKLAKGKKTEGKKTEPKKLESKKTEPKKLESKKTEPKKLESRKVESRITEPRKSGASKTVQPAPTAPLEKTGANKKDILESQKQALKAVGRTKAATPKRLTAKLSVKGRRAAAAEASGQLSQKWSSLYRKAQDQDAKPYNMRGVFEAKTPIMHKMLGWGYILTNKNDRLEVLFKDGIRYLISNYKS